MLANLQFAVFREARAEADRSCGDDPVGLVVHIFQSLLAGHRIAVVTPKPLADPRTGVHRTHWLKGDSVQSPRFRLGRQRRASLHIWTEAALRRHQYRHRAPYAAVHQGGTSHEVIKEPPVQSSLHNYLWEWSYSGPDGENSRRRGSCSPGYPM